MMTHFLLFHQTEDTPREWLRTKNWDLKTAVSSSPANPVALDEAPRVDQSLTRAVGVAALALGTGTASFYFHRGLTLSHYDGKAHLVVARRIFDSLTPGWGQIGAVWLPLPHLLNAIPVQLDFMYQTGLSAVGISVAAFALTIYASTSLVLRVTGSRASALVAALAVGLNPNVLYLQSTPMTESLLLGLSTLGVLLTYEWLRADASSRPRRAGWTFVALCLTRYEGWLIAGAAVVCSGVALWRKGYPLRFVADRTARLALYPVATILAFAVHSRLSIGQWLVTGGFFVPDNPAMGNPWLAVAETFWGTRVLAGYTLTMIGFTAGGVIAIRGWLSRRWSDSLVLLALGACALLPPYAFVQGHPFRNRYMVPITLATAVWCGVGIGSLARARSMAASLLIGLAALEVGPFDAKAPMIVEAQWDLPNSIGRRSVTACLTSRYVGEPILMSMGSLAHYMQELSAQGFAIRNFVHEGNHPLWDEALAAPQGRVGWILIEEQAEGGDVLAIRARQDPAFLHGFQRVCAGGGVALHEAIGSIPQFAAR